MTLLPPLGEPITTTPARAEGTARNSAKIAVKLKSCILRIKTTRQISEGKAAKPIKPSNHILCSLSREKWRPRGVRAGVRNRYNSYDKDIYRRHGCRHVAHMQGTRAYTAPGELVCACTGFDGFDLGRLRAKS